MSPITLLRNKTSPNKGDTIFSATKLSAEDFTKPISVNYKSLLLVPSRND